MYSSNEEIDWYEKLLQLFDIPTGLNQVNGPNNLLTEFSFFLGEVSFVICVLFGIYYLFLRPRRITPDVDEHSTTFDWNSNFKPKISIHLNQTLLKANSENIYEWIDDSILPFLELCSKSELHAFAEVTDTDDENKIKEKLCEIHATDKGFKEHRLMFSSTANGRSSMVRQLQPFVHIDADFDVVQSLIGKIPNILLLNVREKNLDNYNYFAKGFVSLRECLEVIYALPTI